MIMKRLIFVKMLLKKGAHMSEKEPYELHMDHFINRLNLLTMPMNTSLVTNRCTDDLSIYRSKQHSTAKSGDDRRAKPNQLKYISFVITMYTDVKIYFRTKIVFNQVTTILYNQAHVTLHRITIVLLLFLFN